MSDLISSDNLRERILARFALKEHMIQKMDHCIGYDKRKVYHRNGSAYFIPHQNHFYPGGTDVSIWEVLRDKGLAECGSGEHPYFWLNKSGLNYLSAYHEVFIYSDNASGNEIDASEDVLEILLDDAVYCGYGCWLPSGSKDIARRARLPHKLALSTLRYLKDKCGYVSHVYEGGCDDEGFPHCTHGWVLTHKWIEENRERYNIAQIAEYKRIDALLSEGEKNE